MRAKYSHGVWKPFAHTFEKAIFRKQICVDAHWLTHVFSDLSLSCMFQTKCHRQNDRTDRGIISLFFMKK